MKLVIQRVLEAEVIIDQKTYSKIERGFLIYVGFTTGDSLKEIEKAVYKIGRAHV